MLARLFIVANKTEQISESFVERTFSAESACTGLRATIVHIEQKELHCTT